MVDSTRKPSQCATKIGQSSCFSSHFLHVFILQMDSNGTIHWCSLMGALPGHCFAQFLAMISIQLTRWRYGEASIKNLHFVVQCGVWCTFGCVWKWLVPLNPMVLLIIIPIKWLFHWEYTLFSDKPILLDLEKLTWWSDMISYRSYGIEWIKQHKIWI